MGRRDKKEVKGNYVSSNGKCTTNENRELEFLKKR